MDIFSLVCSTYSFGEPPYLRQSIVQRVFPRRANATRPSSCTTEKPPSSDVPTAFTADGSSVAASPARPSILRRDTRTELSVVAISSGERGTCTEAVDRCFLSTERLRREHFIIAPSMKPGSQNRAKTG